MAVGGQASLRRASGDDLHVRQSNRDGQVCHELSVFCVFSIGNGSFYLIPRLYSLPFKEYSQE